MIDKEPPKDQGWDFDKTGNVKTLVEAVHSHIIDSGTLEEDLNILSISGHNYLGGFGFGRQELSRDHTDIRRAGVMICFPHVNIADYEDVGEDDLIRVEVFTEYENFIDRNSSTHEVLGQHSVLARDIDEDFIETSKILINKHFEEALRQSKFIP